MTTTTEETLPKTFDYDGRRVYTGTFCRPVVNDRADHRDEDDKSEDDHCGD
jgi:hypothetical protein